MLVEYLDTTLPLCGDMHALSFHRLKQASLEELYSNKICSLQSVLIMQESDKAITGDYN